MCWVLTETDQMDSAAAKLRDEIDHLRRERLVFLSKLHDLENQLEDAKGEHDKFLGAIRQTSHQRETALAQARR